MTQLNQMRRGQRGIIQATDGGSRFNKKIASLGLHIGVVIEVSSSQLMHGPITIRFGNTQAAIGYGMAGKILVEIQE